MNDSQHPYFTVTIEKTNLQKSGKIALFCLLFCLFLLLSWIALTEFQSFSLPFLFSILLAFLLDPPVAYLESKGLSRTLATFFLFLALLILVLVSLWLLMPVLTEQIKTIRTHLQGDYIQKRVGVIITEVQNKLTFLGEGDLLPRLQALLTTVQEKIFHFVLGLFSAISNIVIIPFITFFLLKDGPRMKKAMIARVPNRYFEMVLNLLYKMQLQVGGYIRGQLLDSFWVGVLSILALYFLHVDYYFFIGAIAGLANLIPYLGPVVGAIPAILVSLMQTPSLTPVLWIIMAFVVIQLIDNVLISPLVVAKVANMHPLMVILVIFVGERLLGVLGMLIAVPVTGILRVIIRETIWSFKNYRLL